MPPTPHALCLAIETSNPPAGASVALGLVGPGFAEVLAEAPVLEAPRHEDALFPSIDEVFRAARRRPAALQLVAVSIGPGGYTSLRVACAAGKMLAEAAGARCVPVHSAASAMVGTPDVRGRVGVCLASKDDTTHLTVFPDGWSCGAVVPPGTLVRGSEFPFGSLDIVVADRFLLPSVRQGAERAGVVVVEPRMSAAACLRFAGGVAAVDPVELNPLYPREPDAVTLWRARHGPKPYKA